MDLNKTTRNKQIVVEKSLKYKGFEKVYLDLALPVYKFIIKKTGGDIDAAEEVSSRTFEAALKGWDAFGHRSSYFTWVCKIALNKWADYYRSQIHERSKIVAPLLEEISKIEDKGLSLEEKLALKELRASVKECLLMLPKQKRQLLYLRYWENLTIEKIAKIVGLSPRSVEGRLYRAKKNLAFKFSIYYPEYIKPLNHRFQEVK